MPPYICDETSHKKRLKDKSDIIKKRVKINKNKFYFIKKTVVYRVTSLPSHSATTLRDSRRSGGRGDFPHDVGGALLRRGARAQAGVQLRPGGPFPLELCVLVHFLQRTI